MSNTSSSTDNFEFENVVNSLLIFLGLAFLPITFSIDYQIVNLLPLFAIWIGISGRRHIVIRNKLNKYQ